MSSINGGEIKFGVSLQTKQNGLKDIVSSLKQVQQATQNVKKSGHLTKQFTEASQAARKLESIINESWNDKLNQLNLNQFNQSVKSSFTSMQNLKRQLTSAGPQGKAAFNQIASSILNTNMQLRQSNKLLDSMATSMANTVKWGITSSIFNNITGSIQKAYYYAKDLDSSLNDIRIVTGDSADEMERFAKTANDAAKDLGRSTLDYTKAALTFYQQGLSDDEVKARTEVSLKAQNITGAGSQMYDQLTAVWNGFKVATEDTESVVDKLAAVADNSASNMSQLATAMSKVAATANVMGVDVDQLTAQISTVVASTRLAPESVGTAFKTIYSRLNDIKTGADEAEVSLGNYSGKMAQLGFNVLDASGNLRDTGQVIEEIGGRWQTLTRQQQVYLAQTMGGQRQITQVMALFDNWDKYLNNLNVSMSSQGTLMEKNNIYLESTQAHLKQLGTEAERTYAILFDKDTVNEFVDIFGKSLNIFNDFIDGLGGGTKAFVFFGTTVANIFSKQISDAILKAKDNFDAFRNNKAGQQMKNQIADMIANQRIGMGDYDSTSQQAITQAAKQQAEIYQQIASVKRGLTQESYNELAALQKSIGVNTQRISLIEQYQQRMNEIVGHENASKDQLLQVLKERKELLKDEQQMQQLITEQAQKYVTACREGKQQKQQETQIVKYLQVLSKSELISEEEQNQIKIINEKLQKGIAINAEDVKVIHQAINKLIEQKKRLLDEANKAYKDGKAYVEGEADALRDQNDASRRLINQGTERAKQATRLSDSVRNVTMGLSSATALVSSFATFTKEGANAAERANAAYAGLQGALPGIAGIIANTIVPGSGMIASSIVTGVVGLGKALLEASGLWNSFENIFKSTKERVEDLGNELKENLEKVTEPLNKKKSLEGLKEEFDELSAKTDKYGQDFSRMTQEEQDRYREIVDQIVQINPDIVEGYDAQHQAIVNNNQALDLTLQKLKEQIELQQGIAYSKENVRQAIKTAGEAKSEVDNPSISQEVLNLMDSNNTSMYTGMRVNLDNSWEKDTQVSGINFLDSLVQGINTERMKTIAEQFQENLKNSENDINKVTTAYTAFLTQLKKYEDNLRDNNRISQADLIKEYFAEIGAENIRDQIKEIENQRKQSQELYDTSIETFKTLMAGALKSEDEYNLYYKEIQNSFGDKFQGAPSKLLDDIINNQLENYKYDNIDPQYWEENIVKNVNDAFRLIFENLDANEINLIGGQLEELSLKSTQMTLADYQSEKIKIINNFLKENENILNAIKDKESGKYSDAKDLLSFLFGEDFSDITFDEEGSLQNYKNEIDKYIEKLEEQGFVDFKENSEAKENFKSNLQNLTEEQYLAFQEYYDGLSNRMRAKVSSGDFTDFFRWFDKKQVDDANKETQQVLIENFDKVTSIIDKLQSGKSLKQKQKDWLKENLHLTDEQLYGLDANVKTLEAIIDKVLNLTDKEQKYTGIDTIFGKKGGLETYHNAQEKGIFKKDFVSQGAASKLPSSVADITGATRDAEDQVYAYKTALEAQQEAMQMNDDQLLIYGKLIGEVTDDVTKLTDEQKEAIITHYNNQQALESLTAQAKALADAGQDMKDEDLSKFIGNFKDLTGIELDPTEAKEKIKAYYAALTAIDEGTLENNPEAIAAWIDKFKEDAANAIVENKDKVNDLLKSLVDGEGLSYEDKGWIKEIFGLTDTDIAQLQKNGKLAKTIFMEAMNSGDQETQKKTAQTYLNLDTYHDLIDSEEWSNIDWGQNFNARDAYHMALENSMTEYGVDEKFLQEYADELGIVGKSVQQLFRIYQKGADSKSLQKTAEDLAKNKDELNRTDKEVMDFRDKINEMFNSNYSSSFIIQNIDAIVDALGRGITDAQAFKNAITNFKPSVEPIEKGPSEYEQQRDLTKNATAAKSSLESKSELTEEQATAIAQLEDAHAELAALGETGNRNSQQYLTLLQQIIELENKNLQIKREQALEESQNTLTNLQKQKQVYDDLLAKQPENIYLQQQVEQIEEKINEEKAKQVQLQQDINQEEAKKLDSDVNEQKWGQLTKYLYDYASALDGVDDTVQGDIEASEELAQAILRFDAALESVQKNYQNWEQMLTSGSVQQAAQACAELQDVYSDLLDLPFENLSPDFTKDLDNLHDLQLAVEGDEQAYQRLRQAALQDILTQVGLDDEKFQTTFDNLQSQINEGIDDIEAGAFIDDSQALQAMNQLINAADMTAEQATDLLASMGVDAEVEEVQVPKDKKDEFISAKPEITYQDVEVPTIMQSFLGGLVLPGKVKVPTIDYKPVTTSETAKGEETVTALKVTSAHKSSGGGLKFNNASHGGGSRAPKSSGGGGKGGGGGKSPKSSGGSGTAKQPQKIDISKPQIDRYHDVNIQLQKVARTLERLQKAQEKLIGKALLDNLNKQKAALEQQIKLQQRKLQIARQEASELRASLAKKGAKFDEDGNIIGYSKLMTDAYKKAKDWIDKYNKMSAEDQQKYKKQAEAYQKYVSEVDDQRKRYEQLINTEIPDMEDTIQDIKDQLIDLQVQKFNLKINLILDTSDAEREFLDFRDRILNGLRDDDIAGNNRLRIDKLRTYFNNANGQNATEETKQHISDILYQIDQMRNGIPSAIYGNDISKAYQELQNYYNTAKDNLEGMVQIFKQIQASIYDVAAAAQEAFNKQKNNYDFLKNTIQHQKKMADLLYGDEAYKKADKFYDAQIKNNLKTLDLLKKQKDLWEDKIHQVQNQLKGLDPNSNDYKELQKLLETYQQNWKQAQQDFNATIEESVQTSLDKYTNSIDVLFDKINDKLTNGKGLDFLGDEWQLLNNSADDYLDKVNAVYEIDKLATAYDDAIKSNEGNLAAQKSLKEMQNEQLKMLREKDKLTKYEVDRANLLLQIEIKRLALEQARQNKSKLRLRRDSQGNYTYQYVADQSDINKAQQELDDAKNSLWNLDKNELNNNLNNAYSVYKEFSEKMQELDAQYPEKTEEYLRKRQLLQQEYGKRINAIYESNAQIRQNLLDDVGGFVFEQYGIDQDEWNSLDINTQLEHLKDILPWSGSGIQDMLTKLGQEGFQSIIDQMDLGSSQAREELNTNLKDIESITGDLKQGIDNVAEDVQRIADEILDMPSNDEVDEQARKQFDEVEDLINQARAMLQEANKTFTQLQDLLPAAFYTWAAGQTVDDDNAPIKDENKNQDNTSSWKDSSGNNNTVSIHFEAFEGYKQISEALLSALANSNSPSLEEIEQIIADNAAPFATGGYTGSWNKSGKIAILHEKQLVLNEEDTKNILDAVSVAKRLDWLRSQIDMANRLETVKGLLDGGGDQSRLDQWVHITATFPSVTQSSEIETALNNLVNQASQYVLRNR